jgi:hypothetical protein
MVRQSFCHESKKRWARGGTHVIVAIKVFEAAMNGFVRRKAAEKVIFLLLLWAI